MNPPIHLAIAGVTGRMGQTLLTLLQRPMFSDFNLVAVLARSQESVAGLTLPSQTTVVTPENADHVPKTDVLIDFSLPAAWPQVNAFVEAQHCALVSGVTGYDVAQQAELATLAEQVAVCHERNFSVGVQALQMALTQAAAMLGGFSVGVHEVHHIHKQDAPSGTAKALSEAIAEAGQHTDVPISALRTGEVIGEHDVRFDGLFETLTFNHRATDRSVFAHGALVAARNIAGRGAGRHALADLLTSKTA